MESHNHPSFIEPYQGAATGVGGILRDVFTMGARPIASLNSLRFGRLDAPRMKHLVDGVVRGIAGYGNCIGIPTVGGETTFHKALRRQHPRQRHDPRHRPTATASSSAGPRARAIPSSTSARRRAATASTARRWPPRSSPPTRRTQKRPTVQVGDPFTEKLLMEACLELFKTDAVVGIQDMGAAGLTSSTFEMAGRGRQRRRDRPLEGAGARDRDDALRDHALRVAGAHAPRRAARPPGRGPRDLPQVGARRGRDRPRHATPGASSSSSTARSWRTCRPRRCRTARPCTTVRAQPPPPPAGPFLWQSEAEPADYGDCLEAPARVAERRREVLDLDAVRPHGPVEHGRSARAATRPSCASRERRRGSP